MIFDEDNYCDLSKLSPNPSCFSSGTGTGKPCGGLKYPSTPTYIHTYTLFLYRLCGGGGKSSQDPCV